MGNLSPTRCIHLSTGNRSMMLCGWAGNRLSGIALTIR